MRLAILKGSKILFFILFIVFVKNLVWLFSTPIFQAPDEYRHFEYVRYLVEFRQIPFFKDKSGGYLSEETVFVMDKLRFRDVVRKSNIRQDFTLAEEREQQIREYQLEEQKGTFNESTNIYTHPPAYYLFLTPFYWLTRNTDFFFRFYLLRLISSLFSLGTVAFTYLLGLELLRKRSLAFGAALLLAFQPTFSFMSVVLNNDTSLYLVYAAVFYLGVLELREEKAQPMLFQRYKGWFWGTILGVGMLTKANFLPALLIFATAVLLAHLKGRKAFDKAWFVGLVKRCLLPAIGTILISGWWYLTNIYLFGEPARGSLEVGTFSPTVRWDPASYRGKSLWYYLYSVFVERFRIIRWGVLGWIDTPVDEKLVRLAVRLLEAGGVLFLLRYFYLLLPWFRKRKVDIINLSHTSFIFLAAVFYDLLMIFIFLKARLEIGRPNFPNQVRYYLPAMPLWILLGLWGVTLIRRQAIINFILCGLVGFMIYFNLSSLFSCLIPRFY